MADVQYRTFTEKDYDGSTGAETGERTVHALGVEVDGVFVTFLTKSGDYVDQLVARGKEAQSQEKAAQDALDTGAPQSPQVPQATPGQ